jgi:hypothetical protein
MRFSPPPTTTAPSAVGQLCERTAGRLLMYFVRHAALLLPLPPPAKLQLAKDLAELQAGVGQGLWPLEGLGPAVRCLRAFRALLFVDDGGLEAGAPPLRDLPASVALHHLFSRLAVLGGVSSFTTMPVSPLGMARTLATSHLLCTNLRSGPLSRAHSQAAPVHPRAPRALWPDPCTILTMA